MAQTRILFHTGFDVIPAPDIRRGRTNADFGQGFYLSPQEDFARRWARSSSGKTTWLNRYELSGAGLKIKRFHRDQEWFNYIFRNRSGFSDDFSEYDLIIGPIANDTIFNTNGVLSSGLLRPDLALKALQLGPAYEQIVLKTEKAVQALRFLDAIKLSEDELRLYRSRVHHEEQTFLVKLSRLVSEQED